MLLLNLAKILRHPLKNNNCSRPRLDVVVPACFYAVFASVYKTYKMER